MHTKIDIPDEVIAHLENLSGCNDDNGPVDGLALNSKKILFVKERHIVASAHKTVDGAESVSALLLVGDRDNIPKPDPFLAIIAVMKTEVLTEPIFDSSKRAIYPYSTL